MTRRKITNNRARIHSITHDLTPERTQAHRESESHDQTAGRDKGSAGSSFPIFVQISKIVSLIFEKHNVQGLKKIHLYRCAYTNRLQRTMVSKTTTTGNGSFLCACLNYSGQRCGASPMRRVGRQISEEERSEGGGAGGGGREKGKGWDLKRGSMSGINGSPLSPLAAVRGCCLR